MPEQGMRSEDFCGRFASRSGSQGAGDHAAVRDRRPGRLCSRGLPGERLLNRLGIKRSDDTVLRRLVPVVALTPLAMPSKREHPEQASR